MHTRLRQASLLLTSLFLALQAENQTALDRYVATPDSHYKYELVKTIPAEG